MHGAGHADDLVGLQMPGNKADAVPCERLPMNAQCAAGMVSRQNLFLSVRSISCLRPEPDRSGVDTTTTSQDETAEDAVDAIVCRRCGHTITAQNERIVKAGAHAHTFANPDGIIFEIGCFRAAWGCGAIGPSSREFTWFPGTEWRIVVCASCLAHLGWRFQAADGSAFHGLILDRLVIKD